MEALDGLFRDPDTVYNVVSKAILSEQAKVDILNHNSIGNGMYAKSKDERISFANVFFKSVKVFEILIFSPLQNLISYFLLQNRENKFR